MGAPSVCDRVAVFSFYEKWLVWDVSLCAHMHSRILACVFTGTLADMLSVIVLCLSLLFLEAKILRPDRLSGWNESLTLLGVTSTSTFLNTNFSKTSYLF